MVTMSIHELRRELNDDYRLEKIESLQRNRSKLIQSLSIAEKHFDSFMYDKIIHKLKTIDQKISDLMNV